MPTLRSIRLLNTLVNGTVTGAQLETSLADAGLLSDWDTLVRLRGQSKRLSVSTNAMTAMATSAKAVATVMSSTTALAGIMETDPTIPAIMASTTAKAAVVASSIAVLAVSTNTIANNTFLNGSHVGAYLNKLLVLDGVATNATLEALTTIAGVVASSSSMNSIAASAKASVALANSTTALDTVVASSTAMDSLVANLVSLNVFLSYSATVDKLIASSTAMTSIAASTFAAPKVAANSYAGNAILAATSSVGAYLDRLRIAAGDTTDATLAAQATLTLVCASATAMTAVIGTTQAAFTAIRGSANGVAGIAASTQGTASITGNTTANDVMLNNSIGVGAYLNKISVDGGDPSNQVLADLASLFDIETNAVAMQALADSATALVAMGKSDLGTDTWFDLAVNKTILFNSANIASLTGQTVARTHMRARAANDTTTSSSHVSVTTGKTLLVGQWQSGGGTSYAGAGSDTYSTTSTTVVDRFNKVTALTHRKTTSGFSYVDYIIME